MSGKSCGNKRRDRKLKLKRTQTKLKDTEIFIQFYFGEPGDLNRT